MDGLLQTNRDGRCLVIRGLMFIRSMLSECRFGLKLGCLNFIFIGLEIGHSIMADFEP